MTGFRALLGALLIGCSVAYRSTEKRSWDLALEQKPKNQAALIRELDDLVGLQTVKDQMHQLIAQVKFNLERKTLDLPDIGGQSLHMSFLGNPGTGKTVVARIVGELLVAMGAISSGGTKGKDLVVEASRSDLVAEYVGQTAPKVKSLVQKALGGVLFIDEAYALVQGDRDSFGREAVDTLIKEMEDRRGELIVIFAGYHTEMASFLAANPGFKSRIAFEFSFPDYTCGELVKIGELQLKSKHMGFSPSGPEKPVCDGGNAPESCSWLHSAIKLETGCCDGQAGDCEQEENRANGNGRTVRNILESSYRRMASRVLTAFTPSVLEQFAKAKQAKVVGDGKEAEPSPPLDCGASFEKVRKGGPFTLTELGAADVRCAFRVLEVADLKAAVIEAVQEQLSANCMRERLPVTVDAKDVLGGSEASSLDWGLLHQKLARDRLCTEPQELLSPGASLLELENSSWPTGNVSSFLEVENARYCDRYYCTKPDIHCKNFRKCGDCPICKKTHGRPSASNKPAGTSVTGSSRPGAAAYCGYSMCQQPDACDKYPSVCGECDRCRRQGGQAAVKTVAEMKCTVCDSAKETYGNAGRNALIAASQQTDPTCTRHLLMNGYPESMKSQCVSALRQTFVQMSQRGKMFKCSTTVGEKCLRPQQNNGYPSYPGQPPAFGGGSYTRPNHNPLHIPNVAPGIVEYRPVERPGSQVEELMAELDALIGLETVKLGMSTLRDAVEFDLWRKHFLGSHWTLLGQSFHMKFLGNPGTGKTVVARIIGKILVELKVVKAKKSSSDFIFKEVSRTDLVGGYVGQTALKVQEVVKSAFGGVLFIDEAYSLVQGEGDTFGREAVDTLIKEIEDHRDKVIVIFAGYHDEMESFFEANPGFESRVPFRFDFADYNCKQLGEIADLQLKGQESVLIPSAKPWLESVIGAKTGCCTAESIAEGTCAGSTRDNGNGRSVRNILESALRSMSVRAVTTSQATYNLVTQVLDSDVASVAGEMLADSLRGSCKAEGKEMPDLQVLSTGPRVMGATTHTGYADLLSLAREDCSAASKKLQAATPKGKVYDASTVPLGSGVKAVFKELDELIGLKSVKTAMREFYCTTQFAQMRKNVNVKPLKSQSYHMRFLGNPGTGKTVVARIVGRLLVELGVISKNSGKMFGAANKSPIFNEVSRSDLVAEYLGQTANKTQHAVTKSLGGVLFLDEAYSLVQGDRDSFGKEAVDTLIKEMEDKREQLVVICAGYEQEMETFFESNPGFKSRVPFTFHFEDYSCPQLSQMGHIMLTKQALLAPTNQQAYDQAVRFSTGCCDKLEECEESRDRGNGRAVRNAVEAGVRFMATRVQKSGQTPTKEMYSQMESEDFASVTRQAVEARLAVACGPHGELEKLTAGKALPGKHADLFRRLQRVITDASLVASMNLDSNSKALGESCSQRTEGLFSSIMDNMRQLCTDKQGLLDLLLHRVADATRNGIGKSEISTLTAGMADAAFSSELLDILAPGVSEPEQRRSVQDLCTKKVQFVKASKVVPFDFFMES